MSKNLRLFAAAALSLGLSLGFSAQGETFEIEENFDNNASFTQGGDLPDGWSQVLPATFIRETGSYFNVTPQSGQYIIGMGIGAGDAVIYTAPVKLAGGSEATIEFQAYLPGGTPASVRNFGLTIFAGKSANIAEMSEIGKREPAGNAKWEEIKASFIPAEDAEYYYAIRLDEGSLPMGGTVCFDTFFFSGTKAEEKPTGDPASTYPGMDQLDPDSENLAICQELPYFENFSDPEHYDGTSNLPIGWASTGTTVWRTASTAALPPASGDYYMITPQNNLNRDERAYTPFFNLQQGVTYTIHFKTHQESTLYDEQNNIRRITTIKLLAGTQQDAEFLPVLMKEICDDNQPSRWSEHTLTFCPAVSGAYTFCFQLEGLPFSGLAAIDDLRITSAVDLARPEPAFAPRAIFNLMNSCMLSMGKDPVRFVNTSRYADETEWNTYGNEYNLLPNGDIDIFFPTTGEQAVSLTATNARGSRTTDKIFNIQHVDEASEQMAITGYDGEAYMIQRPNALTFSTDPMYDFVGGFNHYYRCLAEYYQLPPSAEFSIRTITTWVAWLNYRELYGDDNQRDKPLSVKIYGVDEQGNIDENKCFGGIETTMAEVFGTSGTNEINGRNVTFPEPVKCKGPIYIVFEFSPELDLEPVDKNFLRSYLAFSMARHTHGQTTMYVKPHSVPEGCNAKIGEWCPVSDLDLSLKGLGLAFQLWASYQPDPGSVAINQLGEILFAARYTDGSIEVSGTEEGEWLAVYDTAGKCITMTQATAVTSHIAMPDLPAGVYIVRGNNGSTRFIK